MKGKDGFEWQSGVKPEDYQLTGQIETEVRQASKRWATGRFDEVVCARWIAISDIRVIRVEVE